jgi:uncharacterized protein YecE (DUF72 family)
MELMMSETILNHQETTKNHIVDLLKQLTLAEQNTREERKEIAVQFPPGDEEFSLLEELELLTVNIRGYASQIKERGWIENETKAIEELQGMRVFRIPAIAQFYFGSNGKYEQMKGYIRMLDYLRLLMLEYLQPEQGS